VTIVAGLTEVPIYGLTLHFLLNVSCTQIILTVRQADFAQIQQGCIGRFVRVNARQGVGPVRWFTLDHNLLRPTVGPPVHRHIFGYISLLRQTVVINIPADIRLDRLLPQLCKPAIIMVFFRYLDLVVAAFTVHSSNGAASTCPLSTSFSTDDREGI